MGMDEIEKFRDGIFALHTRRFGTVAEIMIKKLYDFEYTTKDINYDLKGKDGGKIEVKFSRVMKSNNEKITEENIIGQIMNAAGGIEQRKMKSDEIGKYRFDSNMEQIKCYKFDVLYYGLFFSDVIEIYKIGTEEIKDCPGFSAKQHGKGIEKSSDEGQFHINQGTIEFHRKQHFVEKIDYKKLYNLLK